MPLNEADTCRRYVVPKLQATGWETEPHRINEQVTFTDGRIIVTGRGGRRRPGKRADYILRYRPDVAIAVVEAKPSYTNPGQGLQQAGEQAVRTIEGVTATDQSAATRFQRLERRND
jgi:type I restriction enzyme R subunit